MNFEFLNLLSKTHIKVIMDFFYMCSFLCILSFIIVWIIENENLSCCILVKINNISNDYLLNACTLLINNHFYGQSIKDSLQKTRLGDTLTLIYPLDTVPVAV